MARMRLITLLVAAVSCLACADPVVGPQPHVPGTPEQPAPPAPLPEPGLASGWLLLEPDLWGFGIPDSLTIRIDEGPPIRRAWGSAQLTPAPEGSHLVRVTSDAPCVPAEAEPVQVAVAAGQITRVPVQLRCLPSLSGWVVFHSPPTVHAVRLDGSQVIRLTTESSASPAIGSADTILAYTRFPAPGSPELWILTPGSQYRLGTGRGAAFGAGSPPLLAYMDEPGGEVWVRSLLPDETPGNVTNSLGTWEGNPSWSADGTMLAIDAMRDGRTHVDVIAPTGAFVRELGAALDEAAFPAWSPDGTRVAFAGYRAGEDLDYEIYVVQADGTGLIRLTHAPAQDIEPAWSSDGTSIVFTSFRNGNAEIYAMNADGSNPVNLTRRAEDDLGPALGR